MNEIISIIIKLMGALLAVYIVPTVRKWLAEKVGEKEAEKLASLIDTLVLSAQQTLYMQSGAERKAYVVRQLSELGITMSTEINALIESRVFKLHNE